MAVICITGSDSPRLQAVENILMQAGMQAPRPLPKEEPLDIRQWQHHVVSSIDGENSGAIKDPGRLWELLAGEIVLANRKSPLWGWCDPASIRFLDFWLGFAPEFKFLLVWQTPQQLLAERLANSDAPLDIEEILQLAAQQQEMLRFHHRNPERSMLINAADALAHPDLLIAACSKCWKLPLAATGIDIPSSPEPLDALAQFFSYRVASLYPEIDALNREILATATIFAPLPATELAEEPQLEEILADYQALRLRLAKAVRSSKKQKNLADELEKQKETLIRAHEGEVSRLQAGIKEEQQENELVLSQLHRTQEELETVFLRERDAKEQIETLQKEMAAAKAERATLATKFDGLQQELAAARLERDEHARALLERQTQIDRLGKERDEQSKIAADRHLSIKKLITEKDELTAQLAERQTQIDRLGKERDVQSKLVIDLQKQKELLVREHEEQVSRLQTETKEEQQKNELLLLQLHQTQEELETVFLQEQEAKKSIDLLNREKSISDKAQAKLSARYDTLQQELSAAKLAGEEQSRVLLEREMQIDQLNKERAQQKKQAVDGQVSRLQTEVKEQRKANELLLLQLYQVQGELEHYFLQYQESKEQHGVSEVSLQRLLEREPKFYDFEELEVSPGNRGDATPSVNCRFINLIAAGRHFTSLTFSLVIEQGMAGLIFPAAALPFQRPPLLQQGETELVISPQRLNQLATFSSSDWSLVSTLIRLLSAALTEPTRLQWNSSLDSTRFLAGLQVLQRQLEPYEARLRYDTIKLKREQVNPDYEHLWFEFANLSYAGEIWPHFEFRLSCAHVRPDYFGGFPKLEFPAEGSQAPFEGWFIEASDDFGDKLELRFSLPEKALDQEVWKRVTEHDRAFMKALAAELPQFLAALQKSGVQIARPWDQWRTMAAEMQSVMTQVDTTLTAIAVTPAEEQQQNVSSAAGLHYDKARLKREQVNPDYEHLWFEFVNFAFAGESWPHFEFRLSCAHVRPDHFGGFPKLEFPAEGSQAPFEGWFIEASDDFGDKLELRFSVPDKALDLGVWERVTEHDRAFMKALVAELPHLLSTLRQSGVKIRRPWEDWTKVAEEMLPIVTNPPQLKGKKKSSFKKLLRRLNLAEK